MSSIHMFIYIYILVVIRLTLCQCSFVNFWSGEGRACRGAHSNDNSGSYYTAFSGPLADFDSDVDSNSFERQLPHSQKLAFVSRRRDAGCLCVMLFAW